MKEVLLHLARTYVGKARKYRSTKGPGVAKDKEINKEYDMEHIMGDLSSSLQVYTLKYRHHLGKGPYSAQNFLLEKELTCYVTLASVPSLTVDMVNRYRKKMISKSVVKDEHGILIEKVEP
jgi:hypothetical protein